MARIQTDEFGEMPTTLADIRVGDYIASKMDYRVRGKAFRSVHGGWIVDCDKPIMPNVLPHRGTLEFIFTDDIYIPGIAS